MSAYGFVLCLACARVHVMHTALSTNDRRRVRLLAAVARAAGDILYSAGCPKPSSKKKRHDKRVLALTSLGGAGRV